MSLRSLLLHGRHRDRGDLIQTRQVDRVPGVAIHPVSRRPLQFRRCRHLAPDAGRGRCPAQAGRTRSARPPRPPRPNRAAAGSRTGCGHGPGQSGLHQLAGDAIDRRGLDRSGVHVQPSSREAPAHNPRPPPPTDPTVLPLSAPINRPAGTESTWSTRSAASIQRRSSRPTGRLDNQPPRKRHPKPTESVRHSIPSRSHDWTARLAPRAPAWADGTSYDPQHLPHDRPDPPAERGRRVLGDRSR